MLEEILYLFIWNYNSVGLMLIKYIPQ